MTGTQPEAGSGNPAVRRLSRRDVFVWCARLDQPASWIEQACGLLSAEERSRAYAGGDGRRTAQFITGRAVLRQILGWHLGVEATQVELAVEPGGKPFLDGSPAGRGACFNLSHSRDLLLVAVTQGRRLGVDVEFRGRSLNVERLVRRFFTARELEQFLALPMAQRRTAFYAGWTCKEAFLKAQGKGLSGGLRRVGVSLPSASEPVLLECPGGEPERARWRLVTVPCHPCYAGAVCVEGRGWTLRTGNWDVQRALPGSLL